MKINTGNHPSESYSAKRKGGNWLYPILLIGTVCLLAAFAAFFVLTSPAFASMFGRVTTQDPKQEILWASVDIAKPAISISRFTAPLTDSPLVSPSDSIQGSSSDLQTKVPTDPPSRPAVAATETPGTMVMEIVADNIVSQPMPEEGTQPQYSAEGNGQRWIDVNLTEQRVNAYEGDTVVNSFVVSTGLPQTPTVTGAFNIWIKVPIQDMYGPGYYLPDVPYVMYFYEDYGLHGTYWHNNFGTPMSRGCVNLTVDDATWLFNWASVGTVVNVHY